MIARCFAGTVGRTDKGAVYGVIGNRRRGLIVTMDSIDGQQADSVTVYLYVTDVAKKVTCAIYDDAAPRNLIAQTEERNISAGTDGWETFTFSTPPILTSGAEYAVIASMELQTGYGYMCLEASGAVGYTEIAAYTGTYPSTLTITPNTTNHSMYFTYSDSPYPQVIWVE